MTFSIEDLETLAVWLDSVAELQGSRAKLAATNNDKKEVASLTRRRDEATHRAWTCREAAKRLRVRANRGAFTPRRSA